MSKCPAGDMITIKGLSICFPVLTTFDRMYIFRANLTIVKELGDRAAQGRTYGNLGNTHYLLGNFRKAVASHEQVV